MAAAPSASLYVGLMSGTSLDGVDAVLASFEQGALRVRGAASAPLPPELRSTLHGLNHPGMNELHRAALAANALATVYANLTLHLLERTSVSPSQVRAIGAHGQTVRHQPGADDGVGYTLQINQPALLAERTGIDVVADFRSRDVAAGGQGAPLVPPFHQAVFGGLPGLTAVLNVGGISNLTVLNPDAPRELLGFDCGPGNALMDEWCRQHTGADFDDAGQWAASGHVHTELLEQLWSEPYFSKTPPKSTGRDLFNPAWLSQHQQQLDTLPARDVQATLCALTARAAAHAVQRSAPGCVRLIVCGGGALNLHLMRNLQQLLPGCEVRDSGHYGLHPSQVEAAAFAWLARQCVEGYPASVPSVTGARGPRVLGALYPR